MVMSIAHISFLQLNTFFPSNIPNGRRLKKARKALMEPMKNATLAMIPVVVMKSVMNSPERIMLVKGPAMAIFPISSLLGLPNICTAPGNAKINPRKIPKNNARNNP